MIKAQPKSLPGKVRRQRILSLVETRSFVRVADLATAFDISEVTVRSDLDQLADAELIERVHGGAMMRTTEPTTDPGGTESELSFEESVDTLAQDKAAIGRYAASLVSTGDSIIIDVGTTATAVAQALTERKDLENVVVFTSGIATAMTLESAIPRFTVILTGGTLRPRQHSLVNPMAGSILDQIHADFAFIGCNGIGEAQGVTNINLPEAQIKTRMIQAARRTVVVADGTKVGKTSVARIARIDEVDHLVTTAPVNEDVLAAIEGLGVDVTIVP
jgi:DeoR family transcriptional regulator of aga operon